jgi:tripartite motif-containing protein 71
MKNIFYKVSLVALLILQPFLSLPADAALGDFLYKWGSYGSGDGQFSEPWGIAVDSNENVYVVDRNNNRIQVFSNTGTFLRKWGTYGTDDGQFIGPTGIAVDSYGNVYVADTYNSRIQVFSSTGTFLRKWDLMAPVMVGFVIHGA